MLLARNNVAYDIHDHLRLLTSIVFFKLAIILYAQGDGDLISVRSRLGCHAVKINGWKFIEYHTAFLLVLTIHQLIDPVDI
jgi:hypothetical protein